MPSRFALLFLLSTALVASDKKLTLEEIFAGDGLSGPAPTQLRWSPDGRLLSYILEREGGEERDLWVIEA